MTALACISLQRIPLELETQTGTRHMGSGLEGSQGRGGSNETEYTVVALRNVGILSM